MLTLIFLTIASYFLGAIPFGLILVFIFKKIDIRKVGSGNIGTTNVLRVGGRNLAIITLVLDVSKGFVLAYIATHYFHEKYGFVAGLAAVIGHLFPIYLKFKGGKGVATSIGLLLALNPLLFFLTILTWILVALLFKYSSLAAIISFILLPFYSYFLHINNVITVFLSILSIVVLIKHRKNIVNLIFGKESKIKLLSK